MNNKLARKLNKLYLDNYYQFLSAHFSKEEMKSLRKEENADNLLKYFDLIKPEFTKAKTEYFDLITKKASKVINDINNFYKKNFENEIVFNVKRIRKEAKQIEKKLENVPQSFEVVDINSIDEFFSNINREVESYFLKFKNDEFLEIDEIKNSIRKICDKSLDLLNILISQKDCKNFDELYKESIRNNFYKISDNKDQKISSVPAWAKGLLFLSPWIIGFIAFTFYPLLQTFIFSFSKVSLTTEGFEATWIGIENYKNLTQDTDFILAIRNYFANMLVYVPLITVFSLILAILLNSQVKGIGFFRTVFFFPVIITSGPVIKILIEQGVTSMPGLLSVINLDSIQALLPPFLGTMFNVLTNEFIMILWFSGIQILVFITGLQKIDKSVYEASSIDGASKWEQFWKVTLPAINPAIVINVVFTVVMQSIFALNPIILKIQNDMNDTSVGKGYQYSSALAFAYFLIIIITLAVFVLIFMKHDKKKKVSR